MNTEQFRDRAIRAQHRHCQRDGLIYQQPAGDSEEFLLHNRWHVHLENVRGTIAVYRESATGKMMRLNPQATETVVRDHYGDDTFERHHAA